VGELHAALDVPAVRHHLLHEADLERTLRIELVAQHQVVHRVAPAGAP
jgi:hypothetical protein